MKPKAGIHCRNREAWRHWLEQNRQNHSEVWLVYYKKHTGKPTITYRESVEEALCFGWIDGLKRRIDEEQYAQRFTPRRRKSRWSNLNIRLAEKMISEGRMTAAGKVAFEQRESYSVEHAKLSKEAAPRLSESSQEFLESHPGSWNHFQSLAPGYRKQYILWIETARRPETRRKRLREAARLLEENRTLGMK